MPGRSRPPSGRLVVLTGLSGAGKSHALRALEDLGYFCVDNLPTTLMPTFARLVLRTGGEIAKAAVVVDVREKGFLAAFPRVYRQLRTLRGLGPRLVFLEASDAVLLRRFSETRRPHPLAPHRSPAEGIREERIRLRPIRRLADYTLDTSNMTVHELRRTLQRLVRGGPARGQLAMTLISFGYKHGVPAEADLVFDARCLPNPHFVAALRRRTGRDRAVQRYLDGYPVSRQFVRRVAGLLQFLIPRYIDEGKTYLTVAIGCTGGRHRSVAVVEQLRRQLGRIAGVRVRVQHRDVGRSEEW
jgi:UPF0042 nucleotide-binding protein